MLYGKVFDEAVNSLHNSKVLFSLYRNKTGSSGF